MRAGVNFFVGLMGWCAAAATPVLLPIAASAEEEPLEQERREGAERWVPSLSIISGVVVQEWTGTTGSERVPTVGATTTVRPPQKGDDRDVTPYVGGNVELMTPELPIPLSPRLFVGGDLAAAFGTVRDVAREGDAGALASPVPEASQDSLSYSEDTALGQGSETSAELDNLVYGAHVGVAFPLEVRGRQLLIKPSFGWIRYDIEVEGLMVDAECFALVNAQFGCEPLLGGFQRGIRLEGSTSDTFDGIGPGLDVEMDTGRLGPLGTSLFLGFRLYKLLGNRELEIVPSPQSYMDQLGSGTDSARFSFEVDEWLYRVGLGLRFQWLGSE